MKNNSFLTSLSKDLVRDVRDLMAGNSSVEEPLEELGEAAKALTAKQKKHIDKNKNGKIDADDFRRLRAEGVDCVVIHSPYTPDIHGGLAEVTHRDLRTGVVTVMFENMYYKLKKGQFKELPEEFEQLDELSKSTLGSYIKKAAPSAIQKGIEHGVKKAERDEMDRNMNRHMSFSDKDKIHDIMKTTHKDVDKPREKALRRNQGIVRATNRLTKEEVEELDEKTAYQPKMVKHPISGKMVPDGSFNPPKTMPKDKYNPVIGGPGSKEKNNMISAFNKPKNKNEKPNAYYKEETEELEESFLTPNAHAELKNMSKDAVKRHLDTYMTTHKMFKRNGSAALAAAALGAANEIKRKYMSEETEELDEGKIDPAKSASALVNHFGVSDEVKRNKDGSHRFYRGFFYRSGSTSEGHAKKVSNQLNAYGIKHDVVDHGTQDYKPFKGGASVKTQNHHWVDVKIHPGQKINLDESVELDETIETERVKHPVGQRPKGIGWVLKQAGEQTGKDHNVWERKVKRVGSTNEEVELTQEELDNIEAILSDLDEGRGRPPKEGSEAWKRRQTQAAEDVPALGIQLRKAASINKPVTFANGESKQIHPDHINRFNDHMDARKTSQQKAEFQKTANKSHADFVKAVTADIPHRAKDTGEIVKYGK